MVTKRASHFPDPRTADAKGFVAMTADLSVELLLDAYGNGIFPWSEAPVCWYSPDPRAIFLPRRIRLPSNLPKLARQGRFEVSFDQAFERVVRGCSDAHRKEGEWITPGFIRTYGELHHMGYAHSVEVWQDGQLAGGLYGVQLRGLFAGESMFYRVANASKWAFAKLLERLQIMGTMLFDAQVINAHTHRMGAVLVRRSDYLTLLTHAMAAPTTHDGRPWPSSAAPGGPKAS